MPMDFGEQLGVSTGGMFEKKEYIYTVYKEKNLTTAAEKLFVTQPCLSAAIKHVEKMIGMPLFERRTKDWTPTKIGYEYLACAEKIMEIEHCFAENLENIHALKSGTLRIGGTNYVCSYILPVIANTFSQEYLGVDISISEASSMELVKMLRDDRIDIIIDSYDSTDAHFAFTELAAETILLAVPMTCDSYMLTRDFCASAADIYHGTVSASDLPEIDLSWFSGEKFILLKRGNSMYKHAMAAFDACAFIPKISYQLDQLSTSFRLAASGNNICFVTDTMFQTHLYQEDVALYRVRGAGTRTLYVSHKHLEYPSVIIKKFTETAHQVIQQLPCK
ncbi:MAG: LysR family transcriptional regulator [Ruminococcaceae bacterium]|nr:LysR family transcriptional regulator [Oscillospiraceae bacterium]